MLQKQKNGIRWLEFELFAPYPEIQAAVFLRHPDLERPYDARKQQTLVQNIVAAKNYQTCRQVHGDVVCFLSKESPRWIDEADGLITNRQEEALVIRHADCQAAIFFDPVTKTIANVHAGWRGQVKNVYQVTIDKMRHLAGSCPHNVLVAISPSLGPSHAEFVHFQNEWPEDYWQFQSKPTYFDLWALAKWQLMEAGVLEKNIQLSNICTYSHPTDCFSYRREKIAHSLLTVVSMTSSCQERHNS